MYLDNKLVLLAGATGLAGANVMCDLLQHYPTLRIRACAGSQTRPFIQHERVEYIEVDLT
jgi:nucleoside-diphosphate-sugar epimerase